MFGDIIQPTHLLFILVVALLVLGPKRLPEVGGALGRSLRGFREGMEGVEADAKSIFSESVDSRGGTPSPRVETAVQVSAEPKAEPAIQIPASSTVLAPAEAVVTQPHPHEYAG